MAVTQRLEIRQRQALVMTPQLMQAIKLLQLSNLDLAAYVEGELERNPLLERTGEGEGEGDGERRAAERAAPATPQAAGADWVDGGQDRNSAAAAERPDALFCTNDDGAIGCYRGLRDLGLRVPEDVALVGCDGIEDTEYLETPLTTIVQPVEELSRLGWEFEKVALPDAA